MNSPWGMIFNLIKETNLTWDDIFWNISWVNIQMMLADAPRYVDSKDAGKNKQLEEEEDFREFLKL
jgi:hypothetical protein